MMPDTPDRALPLSPERALISGIILRAVLDLFSQHLSGESYESEDRLRQESLDFLTVQRGPWAERRAELCEMAGFDPEAIRRETIEILEGRRDPPDNVRTLRGLQIARDFYTARKDTARVARERAEAARLQRIAREQAKRVAAEKARIARNSEQLLTAAQVVENIADHLDLPV